MVNQTEEDSKVIEYAVKRTMSRLDAWDEEDHEFEKLETSHNELVAYISHQQDPVDHKLMFQVLSSSSKEAEDARLRKYYNYEIPR